MSHEPRGVPATNAGGGDAKRVGDTHRDQSGSAPQSPPSAPEPEDFEAQLVQGFEHPICYLRMGAGMIRDPEYGIKMVTCEYCGGVGRAPQRDDLG